VLREIRHSKRQRSRIAYVVKYDNGAGYTSVPIVNWRCESSIADSWPSRRIRTQLGVKATVLFSAERKRRGLRAGVLRRVSALTTRTRPQRVACRILARPASQFLSDCIEVGYFAPRVSAHDGVADALRVTWARSFSANNASALAARPIMQSKAFGNR